MPIVVDKDNPTISIVDENGQQSEIANVYIEYDMPQKYKDMCTKEFLIVFRNELIRMNRWYSLDSFADEGIPMSTSTCGWAAALYKACQITDTMELYDYWRTLPYYDSDIMDGQLADMLVDKGVILDDIDKYLIKYNIVTSEDDIKGCCECYELYSSEDVDVLTNADEYDEDYEPHICKKCSGINDGIKTLKEKLFEVKSDIELVSDELNIPMKDLCKCNMCDKIYHRNMGIYHNNEFTCHYCNDLIKSSGHKSVTDYYISVCDEQDEYHKNHMC